MFFLSHNFFICNIQFTSVSSLLLWLKNYGKIFIFFLLLYYPGPAFLFAQESNSDSTVAQMTDSLMITQPDSIQVDSLVLKEKPSEIDTVIYYDAKIINNDLDGRKSYFIGDAVVKYKDIVLKAGLITLDWDAHLITAESVLDTTWVPTDSTASDSTMDIKRKGEPELTEGGTKMTGEKMLYNYKTERGRIMRGRTDIEGGKYKGTQIKRIDPKVFNISYSSYTTCDLDSNPHFHFESRRMKMIPNDKVIAKPIILYLGNIPMFGLPFAVLPHKKGRHSGILIPRYGQSAVEGRFLRELGYYWAPNDYFDSKFMVDFFEKTGFLFRGGSNYAIRYLLNGSINGSFTRKDYEGSKERRWDMTFQHNQEIDPTSRFSASGTFVSNKDFYKEFSTNVNTRLNRELRSNATYSKSWPKHKLSLSMNIQHVRDLQDDVQSFTFPQLSFRKGQAQIFQDKKKTGRRQSSWYHSLYFSYNSNLLNSEREYLVRTSSDTTKERETTRRLAHTLNFSLNSPKKYFGWLSLNQSLNMNEDWFDETFQYFYDDSTNRIEKEKFKGFAARHIFNYNASANTKIYGLFPVNIGDIQSFRHVVTPSLSFSYQPDFSDPEWGYYQQVEKPDGETEKRDKFGSGTPSMGGGNINLSVRNLFQMKKGEGEKAKKIDLFNVDLNTAYNLKAEKNKLRDLRSSWQANPIRNLSLSANTTHSFYKYDTEAQYGGLTNEFLWTNGGWKTGQFLRLTDFRLNFRIRLEGKGDSGSNRQTTSIAEMGLPQSFEQQQLMAQSINDLSILEEDLVPQDDRFESRRNIRALSIPWRMNIAFNFDLNKSNPEKPQKRYYMDISGAEISLTKGWRIGYSAHYDIEKKEISRHQLTIYRDLHCWEANIDWVPSGYGQHVYVKVSIKSSILRDIKVEKRGGRRSVLGY